MVVSNIAPAQASLSFSFSLSLLLPLSLSLSLSLYLSLSLSLALSYICFWCDRRRKMWWYQILLRPQSPISPNACLEFNMKTAPHQLENKCHAELMFLHHVWSFFKLNLKSSFKSFWGQILKYGAGDNQTKFIHELLSGYIRLVLARQYYFVIIRTLNQMISSSLSPWWRILLICNLLANNTFTFTFKWHHLHFHLVGEICWSATCLLITLSLSLSSDIIFTFT